MIKKHITLAGLVLVSGFSGFVVAGQGHMSHNHSDHSMHQASDISASGIQGSSAEVDRTIDVTMSDMMNFTPSKIMVNSGETVRFSISNSGKIPHEFVLGDKQAMQAHAEMMRDMPNMKHDEPNMVSLKPGQKSEIIWKFNQAGMVDFACLIPGHMEAGMAGEIMVH